MPRLINENSTIKDSGGRHWSLMGNIGMENTLQELTLVSMAKTSLQNKWGRKGGAFMGEYILIDDVSRNSCHINSALDIYFFSILVFYFIHHPV